MHAPLTLTAQAVLLHLADPTRTPGEQPPENLLPRGDRAAVHAELIDQGLILTGGCYGVSYAFQINDAGRARADRVRSAYRRKNLEYRLLQAVASGNLRDSADLPTDTSNNCTYTVEERHAAVRRLHAERLITGGTNEADLLRATLTPIGERVLESGYAPDDYTQLNPGITVNNQDNSIRISGSHGAVVNTGSGNATSSNNTIMSKVDQFDSLMAELRNRPVQDDTAAQEVNAQADHLRTELIRGGGRIAESAITPLATAGLHAYGIGILDFMTRVRDLLT